MILIQNGVGKVPVYFEHNPLIVDDDGNTVAMWMAKKGIIPPD